MIRVPFKAIVGQTLIGDLGDNNLIGGPNDDSFFLQQGGNDNAIGNDGSDGFFFGSALNSLDLVEGGAGTDTIALQGDYSTRVTLGGIKNVEVFFLASGADTRFGDTADNRYSYNIKTQDQNVAAGGVMTLQATGLLSRENIVFDGSAERDGGFRLYPGRGNDQLTGGAGNDGFFFGADKNMTSGDFVDGGDGVDTIALRGNYTDANELRSMAFVNVEVLAILSSHTNEYGGTVSPNGYDYSITYAGLAAGQRLDVIAALLGSDEELGFNGSGEARGTFRIIGGGGMDHFVGGAGNDLLYGRDGDDFIMPWLGDDLLDGGNGNDLLCVEENLDRFDTVIGGAGEDTLQIGFKEYIDDDFRGVSGIEIIDINTNRRGYTHAFGAQADRLAQANGGKLAIHNGEWGATIDASAMSHYDVLTIHGGGDADVLIGGTGAQNVYSYRDGDSRTSYQDRITNFRSGVDVIDATSLKNPYLIGHQIHFAGNYADDATAQAALPYSNTLVNAVFVSSTHTLWFDTNNDHILNGLDLSIVLDGVNVLQPHDVKDGSFIIA